MYSMYLSDIIVQKPKYELEQKKALNWLTHAHTYAEASKKTLPIESEVIKNFKSQIEIIIAKVGCKPDQITTRRVCVSDYLHTNFDKMEIFNLWENPNGKPLHQRLQAFESITDEVLESFYTTDQKPPHEIIHVTCTGYISPSPAQKIVSKRDWSDRVAVTHAYHMGCYASIPAIRMAVGSLHSPFCEKTEQVDIIHTEICSLHTNPINHLADQLVAQSLFSDGFIKYSVFSRKIKPSLKLLAQKEAIIGNSIQSMTWSLSDFGFKIFLSKKIPSLISKNIQSFLFDLLKRANLDINDMKNSYFAIHPGGPKIICQIQELLDLKDSQVEATKRILKNRGNMSSATLPHIWEYILQNPKYLDGSLIISLAFGPGLSISGVILRKEV